MMKFYTLLIVSGFLLISNFTKAQDYLMAGGIIYSDSGYFYDPGGNEHGFDGIADDTLTFIPQTEGNVLQMIFETFDFNAYYDNYLEVYDGLSVKSPLIGSFDHSEWNYPDIITATNADGALTFVFHSHSTVIINWKASIQSFVPDITLAPIANFKYDSVSSDTPYLVKFEEYCLQNPTSWYWDFGDGITSTERNPTHDYTKEGVYDVSLIVSNSIGNNKRTKTVKTFNVVDFLMSNDTVYTDLARFYDSGGENNKYNPYEKKFMTFYPETEGKMIQCVFKEFILQHPTDWLRVYDGSSTNARLIKSYHDFNLPVDTILATNAEGALTFQFHSSTPVLEGWVAKIESVQKRNFSQRPIAHFSFKSTIDSTVQVLFSDNSSNHPVSWFWDFGDGTTSNEQFPHHTFADEGIYSVTLIAGNDYGLDTLIRQVGTGGVNKNIIGNDTIIADYGYFYDRGGQEWEYDKYDNNTYITVFKPLTIGNSFQFIFEKFKLNADTLYVYDGNTTDPGALIGVYWSVLDDTITATNKEGILTFKFKAQSVWWSGSYNYEKHGWMAAYISLPAYKVAFFPDANGMLNGNEEQHVPQNNSSSPVTAIPEPGYHFLEWQTGNGDFVSKQNPLVLYDIKMDTFVTAIFSPNEYNIVFNSNGGYGSMDNQIIPYKQTAKLSSNVFTKDGYSFSKWGNNKDQQLANFFSDEGEYTLHHAQNDTLYAFWEQKTTSATKINETIQSFNIYPNPADNLVSISGIDGIKVVKIISLTGNVMFEKKSIRDELEVNISGLPAGLYIIQVGEEFRKLIVK